MYFMDNITPLTLFLVLLLGVAFVLLMWLKYLGNTHRFYGVYDIVRSWCAILSVLLLAFSLGEFALMALGAFMCLQGLKEWHNVSINPYQKSKQKGTGERSRCLYGYLVTTVNIRRKPVVRPRTVPAKLASDLRR